MDYHIRLESLDSNGVFWNPRFSVIQLVPRVIFDLTQWHTSIFTICECFLPFKTLQPFGTWGVRFTLTTKACTWQLFAKNMNALFVLVTQTDCSREFLPVDLSSDAPHWCQNVAQIHLIHQPAAKLLCTGRRRNSACLWNMCCLIEFFFRPLQRHLSVLDRIYVILPCEEQCDWHLDIVRWYVHGHLYAQVSGAYAATKMKLLTFYDEFFLIEPNLTCAVGQGKAE